MDDSLIIAGKKLNSRLFLGTGKFGDFSLMRQAISECSASVVTVALRRVNQGGGDDNILDFIPKECILMPNTSGARDAKEAVRIARLAKAAGCGDWIKIEIINDNKYLLPDNQETIRATEILVKEGFTVLPYMSPDLYAGRRLVEAGAAAVMPLGSPIGSNRGVKTAELVRIMVRELKIPVIVDAGLGLPSHASECMEIGCAAVLVNTAVAVASNPVDMAKAFALAVKAGRLAYRSGCGAVLDAACASSPLTGFLRES